ncbi:phage tail protein [Rosenbergiella epipactidis]|uniref:phage tail protein n=1 Tax=Rosenbergiella epipactidis TaxID=1544694 RepID=UPI001F4D49BA|nr:phage tail protein [Rosenbergiella epipactidis]
MDTFSYCVQIGATGTVPVKVNSAQFDDGYKQVSGVGINSVAETWNLTSKGALADMQKVRDFLTSHCASSFYWKNPWGETKMYRVKAHSITPNFVTGQYVELSFTFEQAFAP